MMSIPIFLNHLGISSALGNGTEITRKNLLDGHSPGMLVTDQYSPGRSLMLGQVREDLPTLTHLPREYHSRNNQLLLLAFEQIRAQFETARTHTPATRIAVIIGSSTSGMSEEEQHITEFLKSGVWPNTFDVRQREFASPSSLLAHELNIQGPAYTISTACTSSAKALISGARLLNTGLFDLVIAGGVDTLCKFTIAGFSALESISETRCNPFSANRCGINIGEGAALFIMSKEPSAIRLSAWGESSDGYHISAPDPSAKGALLAVQEALTRAQRQANEIQYLNLHGTATPQNDAMEAKLVSSLDLAIPVSATKPLTGHTLGAAGAIETALCWLTMTGDGRLPQHQWDKERDPTLAHLNFVEHTHTQQTPPKIVMNNNFAFGGNNSSLILETTL